MKLFLSLFFGVVFSGVLSAQNMREYDKEMQRKHAALKEYDTIYRVNYFENIILKTQYIEDLGEIQYINGESGNTITLRPISDFKLGFSFDYKWLAIGFSFTPKNLISKEYVEEIEKTSSIGLNINFFYSDRWRQKLSYNKYNGFYSEIKLNNIEKGSIALGNTSYETFAGSTFFIANRNYSFRAHYAQTERQLKSAGSFIPRLRYVYGKTNIHFNSDQFVNEVDEIRNSTLIAQIGYLYTFVLHKKWYASLGLHPGIGYSFSKVNHFKGETRTFDDFAFAFKGEISLGYNNYRWFYGVSSNVKNYNHTSHNHDQFNSVLDYFRVHLGYRLNDNKPMRKFFGWFEEHLGF